MFSLSHGSTEAWERVGAPDTFSINHISANICVVRTVSTQRNISIWVLDSRAAKRCSPCIHAMLS